MKKTALVLIDIQNIYFTEGPYLLYEPEKAADNAVRLLKNFRQNGLPVIHVKHLFDTKRYIEDFTYLNAINDRVLPAPEEQIVNKRYPNSFLNTNLLDILQKWNITDIVIAGMMSHMCIDTTVRACQNYSYKVTVIDDACTTKKLSIAGTEIDAVTVHKAYMAGLNGMFADVVTTNDYLSGLPVL